VGTFFETQSKNPISTQQTKMWFLQQNYKFV